MNDSINATVMAELTQDSSRRQRRAYLEMSQEEHQAVLDKLITAIKLPAGPLPEQDELYLEQQLSDMLGFVVTAELESQRLNNVVGTMAALPHLKRSPTDNLQQHQQYREAGIGKTRSAFGWFTELGQISPQMVQNEAYHIALPANLLPDWPAHSAELKTWYKYRKVLVISPPKQKAVVAVVGDLGPTDTIKYQFGGSPEVIRSLNLWSLQNQGKTMIFFVDDPENQVPLGPLSLAYADLRRDKM